MTKKINVADLPEFDMTEHLPDDEAIAQYLTIVLEDNDPVLLAAALGDIDLPEGMGILIGAGYAQKINKSDLNWQRFTVTYL